MPPRKSQKKVVATEGQTPYNIHILSEGQSGCPPEQYHALLESVRLHGLYSPVILYQNKILDGRSRYRACLDLGIAPTVEAIEFESDDEARRYLRAANGWRAHVGAEQRAASYLLDPASAKRIIALKVKAEANQKAGKFISGNMSVDEQVGREIGVHRSTVQRILRVLRDANYGGRDQVKKIAAGEMTCSQWTNKVRKANKSAWLIDQSAAGVKQFERHLCRPPLAVSGYRVVCGPGWCNVLQAGRPLRHTRGVRDSRYGRATRAVPCRRLLPVLVDAVFASASRDGCCEGVGLHVRDEYGVAQDTQAERCPPVFRCRVCVGPLAKR